MLTLLLAAATILALWPDRPLPLFQGMLRWDDFSSYLKILFITGGLFTLVMSHKDSLPEHHAEYFIMIISVVLGASLTVMSMNFLMVILGIELTSIASYVLTGFRFDRTSSEASLKYLLFGIVITATTLFGMSILFGLTGSLDFSSTRFIEGLLGQSSPLLILGGMMVLGGLLFKMTSAPFHLWAPDVYEAAPTPVVALFSVVPKIAGLGVLTRFSLALHVFGQSSIDWQTLLGSMAILTIGIGSMAALWQNHVRRLMAYSTIAQAGFLLIGAVTFSIEGVRYMLFYASFFLVTNFLVFFLLNEFEKKHNMVTLPDFTKASVSLVFPGILLTLGFASLTGLPPLAGFSAKLFIFSNLYDAYQSSSKPVFLWLMITGLLATVISLFFYMKIPYSLFLRSGERNVLPSGFHRGRNLFSLFLVVLLVILFLYPSLLMGWLNKINFVF